MIEKGNKHHRAMLSHIRQSKLGIIVHILGSGVCVTMPTELFFFVFTAVQDHPINTAIPFFNSVLLHPPPEPRFLRVLLGKTRSPGQRCWT